MKADERGKLVLTSEEKLERRMREHRRWLETMHSEEAMRLAQFADRHGMRLDWHEPDAQGVQAVVMGKSFDNAMGIDKDAAGHFIEKVVVLVADGDEVVVNLANLLALVTYQQRKMKRMEELLDKHGGV